MGTFHDLDDADHVDGSGGGGDADAHHATNHHDTTRACTPPPKSSCFTNEGAWLGHVTCNTE